MSDPNIEVELTDDKTMHCFKVIYRIQIENQAERAPLEIYLHATQAFDLFQKLGEAMLEYFAQTSAELLRKVFENHEARELLKETLNMFETASATDGRWAHDELRAEARKIASFLAITSAVNHPKPGPPK